MEDCSWKNDSKTWNIGDRGKKNLEYWCRQENKQGDNALIFRCLRVATSMQGSFRLGQVYLGNFTYES